MKINDYLIDLMKKRIPEIIEPSDTSCGAFCKGYRYAKGEWITEKMPEDFEDLRTSDTETEKVVILLKNGECQLAERFFYKAASFWYWSKAATKEEDIVGWKCIG